MKKFLIFSLAGAVLIVLLIAVIGYINTRNEKSHSPEGEASFTRGDLSIRVFYNRPYKKGRTIFGDLVPYGKVWRTGANEATTFESNKDLVFEGKKLNAGKYSLWTIPGPETWTIIFNREYGQWGIRDTGSGEEPNRNPAQDALQITVRALQQDQEFEQFTISFEKTGDDAEMVLLWDKTLVAVPFSF